MIGDKKDLNIKILVAYHKPAKLFKNEIFVPIHVGRDIAFEKSKDGTISNADYDWLLKNTIGDNTGDNISKLNREFCEITAIYWAWKNYDKLGNPDYIGLMHYRTFFDFCDYAAKNDMKIPKQGFYSKEFLAEIFRKYDMVISERLSLETGVHPTYKKIAESDSRLKIATDFFEKEKFYNHYKNMFILRKEDFFEFCEILFESIDKYYKINDGKIEPRGIGYFSEGLTSLIFIYFYISKKYNYLELPWLMTESIKKSSNFKSFVRKIKSILNRDKYKLQIIERKIQKKVLEKGII